MEKTVSNFEINLEQFNGPLAKLLELIEQRQIEVSRLSLAKVTADFIRYIETLGEVVEPAVLADFIVVASRLLLIKSKVLLPSLELTEEEEGDIKDLENRLKVYREFKKAVGYIRDLWSSDENSYGKKLFSSLGETWGFYPPKKIGRDDLAQAMNSILSVLKTFSPETKKIDNTVVSLQEKIEELVQRLGKLSSISFKNAMIKGDKEEIVVLFLAVLHMLSSKLVNAYQQDLFGDIVIEKSNQEQS